MLQFLTCHLHYIKTAANGLLKGDKKFQILLHYHMRIMQTVFIVIKNNQSTPKLTNGKAFQIFPKYRIMIP